MRAALFLLAGAALGSLRGCESARAALGRTAGRAVPPRAARRHVAMSSPFSRSSRSLEKQLRSLALPDAAVAGLIKCGLKSLGEVGGLSEQQLVDAGVPRKNWAAVRAGAALLLAEKAAGIVPPVASPLVASTRHTARKRAKAAAADAAVAEAAAALAAAAVPGMASGAAREREAAGQAAADDDADAAGDPAEIAELCVEAGEGGVRLDRLLAERFPLQSRTYFASLCAQGLVQLDGAPAAKGARPSPGALVSVQFAPTAEMEARPQRMGLQVVHEDAHLLLLNKQAGLVVHPAPGNWEGTLVNGVLFHLAAERALAAGAGGPSEGGGGGVGRSPTSTVVHRLDKGTTGLIAFAKSAEAQRALSALFRLRQVRKSYLAICVGDPGDAPVEIALPIGRDKTNRLRMTIVPEADGGRAARSVVRKLACDGRFSLVQVDIFTGRTHQIRVHLRAHGLPILGDDDYGSAQWNQVARKRLGVRRPLLHAHRLGFEHPFSRQQLDFEAPLPADFAKAAAWIKGNAAGQNAPERWESAAPGDEEEAGDAPGGGEGGAAEPMAAAGELAALAFMK